MTPTIAIGFLAVLIALIGTALHLRILSFHATSKIAQLTIRKKGGERITFFGRTWLMGLIGAGMLAALGFCLVVANSAHPGMYLRRRGDPVRGLRPELPLARDRRGESHRCPGIQTRTALWWTALRTE